LEHFSQIPKELFLENVEKRKVNIPDLSLNLKLPELPSSMGTFHVFDFTLSLSYLWRANPVKKHGEKLRYMKIYVHSQS